jgi:hypothetical protein
MSKPITTHPSNISKLLILRKKIREKIESEFVNCINTDKLFYNEKDKLTYKTGFEFAQSVFDRFKVLIELDELINLASVKKYSNIVVPKFIDNMKEIRLSLGSLREADNYIFSYLRLIYDNILTQMNRVDREITNYNNTIDREMKSLIHNIETEYKRDLEDAKENGYELPTRTKIDNKITIIKEKYESKKAIVVDGLSNNDNNNDNNVNSLTLMKSISEFLNYVKRKKDIEIDSINSQDINDIIEEYKELKSGGKYTTETNYDFEDEISLANLKDEIELLDSELRNYINSLNFVTYYKGYDKGVKCNNMTNVDSIKQDINIVFHNIYVITSYLDKLREGTNTSFSIIHPLTNEYSSVQSTINIGYKDCENSSCLYNWINLINNKLEETITRKKDCETKVENDIRQSIYNIQKVIASDSKDRDFSDLISSVEKNNTIKYEMISDMDKITDKIAKLKSEIETCQYADRKYSNSQIKMKVPKKMEFNLYNELNKFDKWY